MPTASRAHRGVVGNPRVERGVAGCPVEAPSSSQDTEESTRLGTWSRSTSTRAPRCGRRPPTEGAQARLFGGRVRSRADRGAGPSRGARGRRRFGYDRVVDTSAWCQGIPIAVDARLWVFPAEQVVFTRVSASSPTERDAHCLIDAFLWLAGILPGSQSPTVIHDWRAIRSIPRAVRGVFLARRRELSIKPRKLLIAVTADPLVRMVLQTVALGAQLVTDASPIEFIGDPQVVLHQVLGASAPDTSLHARLSASWRARESGGA